MCWALPLLPLYPLMTWTLQSVEWAKHVAHNGVYEKCTRICNQEIWRGESAKQIQRRHDVLMDHKDMLLWDVDTIGRYQ